ncbi:MAG TPA: tannase/feruloyl esterase family alpha/beta hydrolase [Allosphingosinicella sp.]
MKAIYVLAAAFLAVLLGAAAPASAAPCDSVARLRLKDVRIVTAVEVGPGREFTPLYPSAAPMRLPFCRVEGVIEREIGFELWLPPADAWNGRLLVGGVGGQAGSFNYRELERGVRRGYASASTDTGHKASDTHWLLNRPDRAANYAHRANHLLAVKTKAILKAVYGAEPRNAFFVGCSGGGRQALTEVQRYPRDFDGVIAGAPGVNTPAMSARRMWEMQQHSRLGSLMDSSRWKLVADAAVRACDPIDGVRDGIIGDPTRCRFDPASLACRGSVAGPGCLTVPQIEAVRLIHAPLRDENGRRIDDGLLPGVLVSPTPLPEPFTPGPTFLAVALFGDGVHGDPNWDPRGFRIARDLPAIDRVMNLHADDPRIDSFLRNGGKLILYHGWADPLVAPQSTIAYYRSVLKSGGPRAPRSVRLFMAPGVDHCRGGAGPDLFGGAGGDSPLPDPDHDLLSALERWVDRKQVPDKVIAVRVEAGRIVRTRPLCAWPARAHYVGAGSIDQAENFVCRRKEI